MGLKKIYRKGYNYKKAGVILNELSKSSITKGLLDYKRDVSESIMKSMDLINSRYGNSTLKIASEGVENKWKIKREKLTPSYTTNFKDIIRVKC